MKFQVDELKKANLKIGEDDEIEQTRSKLKNAVSLEDKTRGAYNILYEDSGSALERLDHAINLLSECEKFDKGLCKTSELIARARAEVEDASRGLSTYADSLESDPDKLEELEERFHYIKSLKRKHGGSIESCLEKFKSIEAEINTIENFDEVLEEQQKLLREISVKRTKVAKELSGERKTAAKVLEKDVVSALSELGMSKTDFVVSIQKLGEEAWDENGSDKIEFLISPNVGEPPLPLARIASGGELSRIMLAIKDVLSKKASLVGTSVFDEVDSGIGGGIAEVVGRKLKDVARSKQVICITHLDARRRKQNLTKPQTKQIRNSDTLL